MFLRGSRSSDDRDAWSAPARRKQQRVGAVGAGLDDVIDGASAGALRVHAPAGVAPPQPSEHLQHRRVSGDVSAGSSLKTRDRAGARRLGRYLIVLELHARIVIRFETLRHAGQGVTLRRSLPPADYCVEVHAQPGSGRIHCRNGREAAGRGLARDTRRAPAPQAEMGSEGTYGAGRS
jgi:hypothetical protein